MELSPFLLVLIFITCFSSVLSKHKIRHYKDRFKRQQGAHLYLPESYVTEGGDGPDSGPWTDWSVPSPCSRTCGGGVSGQYRQCQEGYTCQGPEQRFFSCNTQDCPDTGDYRAQQCSEYDEIPFENVRYQWVPYTKGPNPCELNCMPKGQRFYYRHAEKVVDGTRCNDENLDVCVNGQCKPVGCDMMLGSYLKEDECRICGGNGSTCNTITNTLALNDVVVGYNDILLIPAGATNILVQEVSPSNNYLAVRNTTGHYYLNGNWRIDFPRTLEFSGTKFHYERNPQGFAAPDKIYSIGPIDEAIFIVLLYQDTTVPVEYKYSLPTNVQPGSEYETYAWTFDEYTLCTVTCGGGVQYRNVSCKGRKSLKPVDETLCDASNKMESSRKCNEKPCEAQWVPHPWGNCSAPCGEEGGIQTREISCQQIVSNGYSALVLESECQGPKPPQQQKCNQGKTCAQWHTDPWTPCDHLCGDGRQSRQIHCFIRDENDKIELLDDAQCEAIETKPAEEQACFNRPCEGVDWITSEWSGCDDICGLTNETRKIFCATASGQIFSDDLCDENEKPKTVRKCDGNNNDSCNYLWYASQWSECSVKCGKGIQTRTLFCGLSTADGVKKVTDDKCDQSKTFETIQNCTGTEECDGEWFSGPWGECSKACGGGERIKKVLCIKGNEVVDVSHCDADKIIFSQEDCNKQPCTEDSELPVNKSTPLKLTSKEKSTTLLPETTAVTIEETEEASTTRSKESEESVTASSTELSSTSESDLSSTSESTTELSSTSTITISTEITETSSSSSVASSESPSTTVESTTTELSTSTTEFSTSTTEVNITTESVKIKDEPGADAPSPPPRIIAGEEESTSTSESSSTVESIGSTTESSSLSTELTSTESTVSGASSESESTETTVSSSTEVSTESSFSTESTTEFSGSTTEFDIFSSTTTEEFTSWPTTHVTEIFKKRQKLCKRKKILQCKKTTYGCCWDNIHAAQGPFDKGCPTPRTCKESTYGCCSDGVSAALGEKNRGCPGSHCNETLFGCCWDKKTPAEGNAGEGCPPKPPPCFDSKWGCCKDNITEAKGPRQKGCEPEKEKESKPKASTTKAPSTEECKKTNYGCCPDGSPATGPQYQGCNVPCANTTFGCCPDKETPAHGYQGEGCCLNSAFGCCPDDITPARGPNSEGCDCQYSPYGCCPDKVTAASGYNNESCGCQYSEHGCCPDDSTVASGPDYKGCPCHSFQFGCCPDGVSIAEGPHQQGCDCRTSEFGCCSDEKTKANGPNEEGCSCDISKYGCCLDGVSKASGDDFEGCEEIPVDYQAACSLPKERGSCRNYTVKWFFDMSYGGCSRFWYGGCEGNENRFRTKEECEGVCVKPQGIERCNLPKVNGSCEGYFLQWYYDKQSRHCSQFVYGGCLGNNNKFETREECTELCSKDDSADPCEQSKSEGPCRGQYRRYFFDKSSGQCQEFIYGGCRGNNNNFLTIEACKQRCAAPGQKRDYCTLPKAEGNCTSREARWYYGAQEQRCLPFYYTGCNGNKNSFYSKDACKDDCPKDVALNTCHLPADIGECGNYVNRWYWDTRYKRCSQFYWGGCGGNENNFFTQEECEQKCSQPEQPEPTVAPQRPDYSWTQRAYPTPQVPEPTSSHQPTLDEICAMVPEAGPCSDYITHYYYDGASGVCRNFTYGGCGGNYNNFESEEMCLQYCGSVRVLPPIRTSATTQIPPGPSYGDSQCLEELDVGNCTEAYSYYYYDRNTDRCTLFMYTGCGGNRNRFYSEEDCQRQCGEYRGQDICKLDRDPGPCSEYQKKFYFDRNTGTCQEFEYGGCEGNGNRFSDYELCRHYCPDQAPVSQGPSVAEVCQMPADQGSCPELNHKRWYFDNIQGECKVFIYSGCGGNQNNFKSFQTCLDYCKYFLPHTEPSVPEPGVGTHECQARFEECTTLRCPYGIEAWVDDNGCNGCRCRDPCKDVECPEETQCAIDLNRNKTSPLDADFVAICREKIKPGGCPYISRSDNTGCENECRTDADCSLHLKCCTTECGTVCVEPEKPQELVTQPSASGYTTAPWENIYYAPKVDVQLFEPEVTGILGDQAILNCAVSGNPNPKISWSKDNLVIDGTQPRYRIRLDQTLQIITLHKTDAGVYLCTADNSIGQPVKNSIALEVTDPVNDRDVTILNSYDPELSINNVVTSFNSPATLNCYALGWPLPAVTWWKEDELIPFKDREFEVTKDYSLIIHSVQLRNLGVYTCQAYNGKGKAASWSVTVKAKGPYYSTNPKDIKYLQYVVNPPESTTSPPIVFTRNYDTSSPKWPNVIPVQRPTPQPYVPPYYSTEPSPDLVDTNEIYPQFPDAQVNVPQAVYSVPVRANITTNEQRYPTGSNIQLNCDAYGYPPPQVQWYKDGVPLYSVGRISISETYTLTISAAEQSDSGRYSCEATNQYTKASSTLDVLVEGMFIHPTCTDNQFFADCALIVKARFCNHKYYAKFCCRSCTEAGQLPTVREKQTALDSNRIE
ncbi:hypothetical protein ABEB36_002368 [Hypothenemus hampei]|uniref:Papilin n=1 Tax=Hypothenemus hampei TaxID=57062 RepID=A0ABD1F5L1_HYPHA